ncbi:hypothetical protein EBT16_02500 [bacterium]|nr:hypothetical protein [bacterium]
MRLDNRKFAETIQTAYYSGSHRDHLLNPSDEAWKERIHRAGAKMVRSDEAEMELEKNPDLCSCADPGDYFCRTTRCVHATVILASKEAALKIIILGLP